ncbi:hypothetical protein RFI_03905 [Reticulomyxa filosa]|uniref:Uncharacterized protein n=1 Tax=Reticulomyxa filosa TaxID=46433 RepID=X6P535_RETFI|nr:hypothetical protein RFI_03905 [Reticulomyxa filosa]|eukprot:ETO33199.1 hypothetical protein RFI_03905 [Reticulomyxa filosa]
MSILMWSKSWRVVYYLRVLPHVPVDEIPNGEIDIPMSSVSNWMKSMEHKGHENETMDRHFFETIGLFDDHLPSQKSSFQQKLHAKTKLAQLKHLQSKCSDPQKKHIYVNANGHNNNSARFANAIDSMDDSLFSSVHIMADKDHNEKNMTDPFCHLKIQDIAAFRYTQENEKDWIFQAMPKPIRELLVDIWHQVRQLISDTFLQFELDLLSQSELEKWYTLLYFMFLSSSSSVHGC